MGHRLALRVFARIGVAGALVCAACASGENGVYYARLHLAVNGEVVTVDSRPSDAVAIALRMDAPLFASDSIMTAALETDSGEGYGDTGAEEGAGPEIL